MSGDWTSRLPYYNMNFNEAGLYCGVVVRRTLAPGDPQPTGSMLLEAGLIRRETAVNDAHFIRNVHVYDETYSKCDQIVAHIHREAVRLLFGEESVMLLEQHKRMSTTTWIISGGGAPGTKETGGVHIVVRRL
jgi:hypothetical protein